MVIPINRLGRLIFSRILFDIDIHRIIGIIATIADCFVETATPQKKNARYKNLKFIELLNLSKQTKKSSMNPKRKCSMKSKVDKVKNCDEHDKTNTLKNATLLLNKSLVKV